MSYLRRLNVVNRTVCDTLEAMRKCYETRNFSYLPGIIEEAQNMVNSMEAALWDQRDIKSLKKRRRDLKDEIKLLKEEKKALKLETGKKEVDDDLGIC